MFRIIVFCCKYLASGRNLVDTNCCYIRCQTYRLVMYGNQKQYHFWLALNFAFRQMAHSISLYLSLYLHKICQYLKWTDNKTKALVTLMTKLQILIPFRKSKITNIQFCSRIIALYGLTCFLKVSTICTSLGPGPRHAF